jgi:antitoxin component YwqK of YwqJK toxin-antitoxin module
MPSASLQPPRLPARLRVLAALAACALLALVLLILRSQPGSSPGLPEVAPTQVELRTGRWFFRNQSNALTGWLVEHYASGTLKSRSLVSNGWLEGRSVGWHTNGQQQVEEHYRAGVAQGRRLKWNADGTKLSEAQIVKGKLHGTFRRWHPDGSLAEETSLKNGEPDGLSRAYYPSGFLKAEARLRQGQMLEQKFWSDGEHRAADLVASGGR